METDRFWQLLARVKAGEASPEEQLDLHQYLAQHPDKIALLRMLDAYWKTPFLEEAVYGDGKAQQAWHKLQSKLSPEPALLNPPRRTVGLSSLVKSLVKAAVFVALVAGFWVWDTNRLPKLLSKNTVSTKNGSKSKVDMPDGTHIWLNVGSRIEYDENYGKDNREITLSGEAYFDVAHNDKSPFIIHTPKMNVKVLGTVFNVKAYAGDEITEASLIKGRIEVTFPGGSTEKLIMQPKDKITVVNKQSLASIDTAHLKKTTPEVKPEVIFSRLNYQSADSTIVETAWVQNKFIFRSKKFDELSRSMERWFGVSILVQDSMMLKEKFTGTFNYESITGALDALQLSYPFHYKFEKNNSTVTIYKKKLSI